MLKYNNLIKQTNRANMKMEDVEKIADIQWAKTLKKEKAELALISSANIPLYHHTSQQK